ncbi:MAG: inorganic phosphate transporter [Paludibacteraceae bacterium]|nr:inorganic phosphate transporter [Paludibacteraceae bacterium]
MGELIGIIVLAICFDFINGFHDSANSIATVVSTKVLKPVVAVVWAAFFNFVAFFAAEYLLGFNIANTVQKVVEGEFVTLPIIIAGLSAAIVWSLITWWKGIPSSSSHTLIGGLIGAAICCKGVEAVHWSTVGVICAFIVVAPLLGFLAGNIITLALYWCLRKVKPYKIDTWSKRLQLVSSACLSTAHGLNDSQKEIGVIACALAAYGAQYGLDALPTWLLPDTITQVDAAGQNLTGAPVWIPVACITAIALGTMSGGWKIIKTMGNKITKITPYEGFCSQAAGAITLFITQHLGVPVSTTHVISGSIMGVGSVKRLSAVRWGVSKELLIAWVITIPVSAVIGAAVYGITLLF